jgi:hypothetical protein
MKQRKMKEKTLFVHLVKCTPDSSLSMTDHDFPIFSCTDFDFPEFWTCPDFSPVRVHMDIPKCMSEQCFSGSQFI